MTPLILHITINLLVKRSTAQAVKTVSVAAEELCQLWESDPDDVLVMESGL